MKTLNLIAGAGSIAVAMLATTAVANTTEQDAAIA
ncbi:MAG: hypothetical protein ACJAZ0_001532, partial [Halioglobus sp.]